MGGPLSSLPPPRPPLPPSAAPETVCYRHPRRPTGRACTRCGRPACSECLTQAAVGSHCRECVAEARPAASVRVSRWSATRLDLATRTLIAINVAVFIASFLVGGGGSAGGGGAFSGGITRLHQLGALIGPSESYRGEILRGVADGAWWRLVTSGFLHFGVFHIALNMWVLWNVGPPLERAVGRLRYVLLYFAALLGGSAGAMLVSPHALGAGASGAIFGLFGAFAAAMHRQGVNPFRTSIGTTLLLNLGITFLIPGISIGAHIGGMIAGAICGWFMVAGRQRPPAWANAVPVAVIVAAIAIAEVAARR